MCGFTTFNGTLKYINKLYKYVYELWSDKKKIEG